MADIRAAGFSPYLISNDHPTSNLAPLREPVDTLEASNLLLTRDPIGQDTTHSGEIVVA